MPREAFPSRRTRHRTLTTMRLLVANFFPAFFPPSSGGEQRYYYLYRHLSRWHDVTLFSATYSDRPEEVIHHTASFREYRVPKPAVTSQLHHELDVSGIGPECSAFVVALSGAVDSDLRKRFRALAQFADVVIHESPFTFPLDESAYTDGKPRVYASYNVEYKLAEQMLRGESGCAAARFIRFLESLLVRRSQLVFATSQEDRDVFVERFGGGRLTVPLLPNGFEPGAATDAAGPQAQADERPYVTFIGSAHPPNVEAARFICETLAPAVPGLEFRLMGSACSRLEAAVPANVHLLGFVEEGEMRAQLAGCAAALNPLFTGSGTNLKMLQYMEAGAPILTTPVGARGLDLRPGVEAIVCPSERFVGELRLLQGDPARWKPLGAAARRKAYASYSWEHIAEGYRRDLQTLAHALPTSVRKRVIVVNDFPVNLSRSGGEVRIFELLRELAVDFDVEYLCLTEEDTGSETQLVPWARQRAFPKTAEHREAQLLADAREMVSVRDIVAAEWVRKNELFVCQFLASASRADVVVFEHPYLEPLAALLPSHAKVVYSALNVEEDLKRKTLAARADGPRWLARVAQLERALIARADAIVAVSADDAGVFRRSRPEIPVIVVENGVREMPPGPRGESTLVPGSQPFDVVFLGSSHPPNVDAARFVFETLAAELPDVHFHLIGSVCHAFVAKDVPPNVMRHGVVDNERKQELLRACKVAVNPMASGGGSSLKIPDYLAAGLALISTRTGVRGFALRDGVEYVEAELADFAPRLRALLKDSARCTAISGASRRAVQQLRWPVLGARYRRMLRSLMKHRSGARAMRLLVVTYRFMRPPPGGAESYLNNLLAHLGSRPDVVIDVAACDVGTIRDKWHFCAEYEAARDDDSVPPGARRILRFAIDAPSPCAFDNCRALFCRWMEESRRQSLSLQQHLHRPILMGGWNFPEGSGETAGRWSSLSSLIHVGREADALRIEGASPEPRRVALRAGAGKGLEVDVDGAFSIDFECAGEPRVELLVDRALYAADDPRELGVRISRIALRGRGGWADLDLRGDLETQVKEASPDDWIDSLITLTEERPQEVDDLFFETRGPHSAAMTSWLEGHAADYDVAIVQGVPFAPLAWASPILRKQIPVVLLPHYHVEDRFYHWRRYYQEFRGADRVLSAPGPLKAQFFDKIDAAARTVPGGGIDLAEFKPQRLEQSAAAFRSVHKSRRPYVLVLGRKAGGKRYGLVLEAARSAGTGRAPFDVVMIGPDDDRVAVEQPDVHYYGPRPREFVLGALSGCLCLVNMSESESFGIVLLEAWAARRPVVAQRNSLAFRDLVVHGVNGYFAATPEDIRRHVEDYLADPGLAARHGDAGHAVALRHSWAALADQIHEILEETLEASVVAAAARPAAAIDA